MSPYTGADPEIFQRGGVEEENFERKMFVNTRLNACPNKNRTNMQLSLSSSLSRGLFSFFWFFLLFFFFLIARGGGVASPVTPPL